MSESDTMLNEWDQRCAAVQLMLSTDPSYETEPLPAPSKCKSRWFNAWGHSSMHWMTLWRWWSGSPRLRTPPGRPGPRSSSKRSRQSLMKLPSGVVIPWWQTPGVAAGLGTGPQVQRDPAFLQKECYNFVPFSHWPPSSSNLNPLDYFVWSYVKNITNMTSHNTKASLIAVIRRVFAKLPPALVKKACSQFLIRMKVVIEAEGGYIE